MATKRTRREFMTHSAALGSVLWIGGSKAFGEERSANGKLNVAVIGCDGKGSSDCDNAAHWGAEIVALCDIDDNRLKKKGLRFPDAKQFPDYREMLDQMGDKIDAVTVSTADHSHAPASVMAMKKKKHVYCQKPLTWSAGEARKMREIAKQTGVVTQMGNQGTSENGLREAVEIVKAGGIGEVKEVHVWTNRPIWDQGIGRPKDTPPIPKNIHWDLFLGPAPERPYHPSYQPFSWRGWVDYGTGALGDMACHTSNMVVMALDLFDPHTIEATHAGVFENETFPKFSTIKYQFGQRGKLAPCQMTWYDGGKKPPAELLQGEAMVNSGSLMVGSEGTIYSPNDYGAKFVMLPRKKFTDFKQPPQSLPRVEAAGGTDQRHMSEFISACKGEGETMSNFDYAGRLTETILLGNLALRLSEPASDKKETVSTKIQWDSMNMKVVDHPEADELVMRKYRTGWSL